MATNIWLNPSDELATNTPYEKTAGKDDKSPSFITKVMRVKPITPTHTNVQGTLTKGQLTMFGIGNTIGAGVFALTGIAVQYSGPSLCLGFLFSGLIALCTAVMYAELSSRLPVNGSAFAFTYATFGELLAWLVGWNLNLRYGISSSGLARGISSYFVGLMSKMGWVLPGWVSKVTFFGIENCCPLAPFIVMILSLVSCLGTQESQWFNMILTLSKIVLLSVIILCAFWNYDSSNMTPFFHPEHGIQGTLVSASIIFYGYLGFDVITTISEEAKNPKQDVPAAVQESTLVCITFYFLTALSLCGMGLGRDANYDENTAMADVFTSVGMPWMTTTIYVCGLCGITAACFVNLMSIPKVLQSQANDGLLPQVFAQVNPQTGIPVLGSLISSIVIMLFAFLMDLEQIARVISCSNLLTYSFVSCCGIALRFRGSSQTSSESYVWLFALSSFVLSISLVQELPQFLTGVVFTTTVMLLVLLIGSDQPNAPKSEDGNYIAPFVPLIPACGIFCNFLLTAGLDGLTWLYLGLYSAAGLVIYFAYGIRKSKLQADCMQLQICDDFFRRSRNPKTKA